MLLAHSGRWHRLQLAYEYCIPNWSHCTHHPLSHEMLTVCLSVPCTEYSKYGPRSCNIDLSIATFAISAAVDSNVKCDTTIRDVITRRAIACTNERPAAIRQQYRNRILLTVETCYCGKRLRGLTLTAPLTLVGAFAIDGRRLSLSEDGRPQRWCRLEQPSPLGKFLWKYFY